MTDRETATTAAELLRLDDLPSDAILNVLSHLNVYDLSRTSSTSRRFCYLTSTLQTIVTGPECAASSGLACLASADSRKKKRANDRPADVVRDALSSLRSPPTVAFAFRKGRWGDSPAYALDRYLPKTCAVLTASASDLQCNVGGGVECASGFSVMLASLGRDRGTFLPFDLSPKVGETEDDDDGSDDDGYDDDEEEWDDVDRPQTASRRLLERLRAAAPPARSASDSPSSSETAQAAEDYWKIIFVYVSNDAGGPRQQGLDEFVSEVQSALPRASVVGGICAGGHVRLFPDDEDPSGDGDDDGGDGTAPREADDLSRKTLRQLRRIVADELGEADGANVVPPPADVDRTTLLRAIREARRRQRRSALVEVRHGIFGLAIGGDVPVRTVVSRGVRSLTSGESSPSSSPWIVSDAAVLRPRDDAYPFSGDPRILKPCHLIDRVRNRDTGEEKDGIQFLLGVGASGGRMPEFLGLKLGGNEGDGFELEMVNEYNVWGGRLTIEGNVDSDDVADLRGCEIDLFAIDGRACLEDLDEKVARLEELVRGERLLGGLMFSCNGRGPGKGYLIDEEMADATRFQQRFPDTPCLGFYAGGEIGPKALVGNRNIFQSGNAAVQGFTVVFALFIVPEAKLENYHIDDCEDSIARHMQQRMGQVNVASEAS